MYDNCRAVLEVLINTFCGQDKLHKLMSNVNFKESRFTISESSLHFVRTRSQMCINCHSLPLCQIEEARFVCITKLHVHLNPDTCVDTLNFAMLFSLHSLAEAAISVLCSETLVSVLWAVEIVRCIQWK